ncbi:uncharacterized protein FOMMEDRAFT_164940 [Fomitiporia mediterranea MF3/22]|uniref:uncharacterized protein n=1 Tax=Fomitiporia mediterranea (strain MF3/22) TaxID=694068 RepID=UPI0004407581|nr:uncharacterized protein FOMMEDRAFT_164940 [Fomitiporia mediterranea MF3/22]EJD08274.1 hypothetical protein FOMMEDRAFT_164940 [Fomitiporia mediterranea MF3/22]
MTTLARGSEQCDARNHVCLPRGTASLIWSSIHRQRVLLLDSRGVRGSVSRMKATAHFWELGDLGANELTTE